MIPSNCFKLIVQRLVQLFIVARQQQSAHFTIAHSAVNLSRGLRFFISSENCAQRLSKNNKVIFRAVPPRSPIDPREKLINLQKCLDFLEKTQ